MDFIQQYLPAHEGLLPKWLLLVSIVSVGNSIQAYSSLWATQRVYCGPSSPKTANLPLSARSPVTPLSARTFGTWTFITSIVRLYAAYNIDVAPVYAMAFWTYVVAWAHFMSEWWVFGSTSWDTPLAFPVAVASGTLVWMWTQWSSYVS